MEQRQTAGRQGERALTNWTQWQRGVLDVLHADASGLLRFIEIDQVDWDTWRIFFLEGRSPQGAVDRALTRDY